MIKVTRSVLLIQIVIFWYSSSFIFPQHSNKIVGNYFSERVNYPNEPSVAINKKNPDQLFVGTNGPAENYYYSTNGGESWIQAGDYSFEIGMWGDPCVVSDTSGNFYFFHLLRPGLAGGGYGLPDRIYCRKISGNNLQNGWSMTATLGYNPPKMQDKEWAVYDPKYNNLYVVWTEFDEYGSSNPDHKSNVLFSRSTDQGLTWSDGIRINEISGDCLDGENTPMQAVPTVGPNGEIYVSWPGPVGIVFDRSTDQGETWLDEDIFVSDKPGGRPFPVPGIYRGGSLPMITCDISDGPYNGTIYINWPDLRNGSNDADIWLSKSTDQGDTWSDLVRVNNDPPGNHQLFPWLTVDQANGNLYCIFYDRRNYEDRRTDVYLAFSSDGGESFSNHKISSSFFVPYENVFMGDYSTISAHSNVIRPVWARMDWGNVSISTALIDLNLITEIGSDNIFGDQNAKEFISAYPNPFNSSATIKFKVNRMGMVNITIFNVLGDRVKTLVQKEMASGNYEVVFNAENLPSGIYFYRLQVYAPGRAGSPSTGSGQSFVDTKKMVLMK
jgi:hypothetical protein